MDVTAVSAHPANRFFTLKYNAIRDILRQRKVSLLVAFLSYCDASEGLCDFVKSFLFSNCCEFGIHFGCFVMFAGGGCFQILNCAANDAGGKCGSDLYLAALEKFEFPFGVLFLLIGRLFKNCSYLYIAFFFGLAGMAKYVYLFLACDSPAKAANKFFSV